MRGLPTILSLFRNVGIYNQFNNTGARMLESIYHKTLRITLNTRFWCEKVKMLSLHVCTQRYNWRHCIT